ncbi:hypothetical protein F4804DRAFT_103868 [Jackrogersella minutella]|nr:hypothetical protein F4804DRAFT_103868 [Jackrogersella minutella]
MHYRYYPPYVSLFLLLFFCFVLPLPLYRFNYCITDNAVASLLSFLSSQLATTFFHCPTGLAAYALLNNYLRRRCYLGYFPIICSIRLRFWFIHLISSVTRASSTSNSSRIPIF